MCTEPPCTLRIKFSVAIFVQYFQMQFLMRQLLSIVRVDTKINIMRSDAGRQLVTASPSCRRPDSEQHRYVTTSYTHHTYG